MTATSGGIYVNYDSNETIVNVGCDKRVCVTIIPRSVHYCVWWLYLATQLIAEQPHAAPEIAAHAKKIAPLLHAMAEAIPQEHRIPEFLQLDVATLRAQIAEPEDE